MRMLFWCGCALAVTAATVVYLAADYAHDHPDSSVGRGVVQAYRMVTDYNPFLAVSHVGSVVKAPVAAADHEPSERFSCGHSQVCGVPLDVIDLTDASFVCDEGAVQVEETATGSLQFGVGVNSDAGVSGIVVVNERNFDMPQDETCPADDYYGCPDLAYPQTVPGIQPWECAVQGDDCEAAAAEQLGMPRCMDEEACPRCTINMEEKPRVQDDFDLYLEQVLAPAPEAVDVPEGPQEPPYYPEEGNSEESEAINPGMPPDCKEVPDYHYHHPECPYMSGNYCPRSYNYPSYEPPVVESPKPKKHKVKKVSSDNFRVPQHLMIECEGPDCWPGSVEGVDTMECRPADLKKVDAEYPPYE